MANDEAEAAAVKVLRILQPYSGDQRHRVLIAVAVLLGHEALALDLLERRAKAIAEPT
jgi:hypothetical protein